MAQRGHALTLDHHLSSATEHDASTLSWLPSKQNYEPLSTDGRIKSERTIRHPKRPLISLDGVFAVRGGMQSERDTVVAPLPSPSLITSA